MVYAGWSSAGLPYLFGQIAHLYADGKIGVQIFGAPRRAVGNIQALDGVFIAMRRPVLDRVRFDEVTFDGFHLYDLDFCLSAYKSGLKLGVANDINLLRHSTGSWNQQWHEHSVRFCRKWAAHLAPPNPPPAFKWAYALTNSRQHAAELMDPPYWREQ